jgi:hypothetical protein
MVKFKNLSKTHWEFHQFLQVDCGHLYRFLAKHAPMWEEIYVHAYTNKSAIDTETVDGMKVSMIPYKLWQMKFGNNPNYEKSIFMLCCMGLLGIDEEDFCVRKEWIFFAVPEDYNLSEWYCKILNTGIKRCRGQEDSFTWIKEELKDGCTYHKVVSGNRRNDYITVGNPGKLAGTLF